MMKKIPDKEVFRLGHAGLAHRWCKASDDREIVRPSQNVEQVEQDDDRNGDADQPQKYAAHCCLLSVRR